jgi:Arc/MetJ-type ribon-helix-helix transcriptional regulator
LTEKEQKDNYATVRLPKEFALKIDKLIGKQGFTSRAEIVKEAVRVLFSKLEEEQFIMINHDDLGVKVWDKKIKNHAQIQFTPQKVYCCLCDATNCEHIRFAFNQPDVQEAIRERRKEGWKIELPDES